MAYWIDSHCHMNSQQYRERFDDYMTNARALHVDISNVICLTAEEFEYSLNLQKRYPNLDVSFGYYPEDCENVFRQDLDYLEKNIGKIRGLGEIGLDYHGENVNKEKQKQLFIAQIELANRYHKPILIHCREAAQDCYDILKQHAKTKVLMHCFSESNEMMKCFLRLGCYISFSGVVTFKNAVNVKENALDCPLDRMMIETDCPYLTPMPFRGKMNETAYCAYTGKYIAQMKAIDEEALQQQLAENYRRFFDETTD